MQGRFENSSPCVDIEIWGYSKSVKKTVCGIVDTGFNGFLKLPFAEAFPIGLILAGTETSFIADGSQTTSFSCLGSVNLFDKTAVTFISVAPNCPILIGTQLLAKLGLDAHVEFKNGKVSFTEAKQLALPAPKEPRQPRAK